MQWYLGISAFFIFIAGSLMSWGHTASFFADNGFGKGYDPYYGVVVVECLFLMGAGAEIYLRKVGRKSTWAIKLALWGGGAVVFWANLRYGWDYGWEGVVAGSIIVAAILIAETVLADIVLEIQRDQEAKVDTVTEDVPESGTPVPDAAQVVPDSAPTVPTVPDVPEPVQDDAPTAQESVPDDEPDVPEGAQDTQESARNVPHEPDDTVPDEPDDVPVEQEPAPLNRDGVPETVPPVPAMPDTPAARLYMYHRENGKLPGRVRMNRMTGIPERNVRRALTALSKLNAESA